MSMSFKSFAVVLFLHGVPALAQNVASQCTTAVPIQLDKSYNLTKVGITLRKAVFYQSPHFAGFSFEPSQHELTLRTFAINVGEETIMQTGAAVFVVGAPAKIGFEESYQAFYDGISDLLTVDGSAHYRTALALRSSGKTLHYRLKITLKQNTVTSVRLVAPVFGVTVDSSGRRKIYFTGNHQTLCLKSAVFEKAP